MLFVNVAHLQMNCKSNALCSVREGQSTWGLTMGVDARGKEI